ncbi:LytR/AlgR family response regulator transcription factor [uncultured Fibrella sp.]|uniref:LytR/AlgR family response regulator transcription factor n=1 Tax=uncultured Fibrella sp. TaxID=1284596 RepID=UPI0035CB1129
MQTYRCLIVDDSESAALLLKQYLTELSIFSHLTICPSHHEAISALFYETYDLIFLDIELNANSGLDLLRAGQKLPPVIVTSAYSTYAVDCYDLDIADYLQKPFSKSRLLRGVHRAIGMTVDKESIVTSQVIFLKVGRRLQKFAFCTIDYIEAYGIYCKVHYKGKVEVVNEPIMVLEERLPTHYFRRVHKSYIVNLDHITSYNHNNFFFGEAKIPIGISYRDHLPNIYQLLG